MPGFVHRLKMKDNISTENILPERFIGEPEGEVEITEYLFCDIDPGFAEKLKDDDFIVAGDNFGCGSSRNCVCKVLKDTKIKAIIAQSYSRIFYRNAVNQGFLLIECDTKFIDDMDEIELDMDKNILKNLTKGIFIKFKPIPDIFKKFLTCEGAINYFREKNMMGIGANDEI